MKIFANNEIKNTDLKEIPELNSLEKNHFILPGFFDIHTHGGYGYACFDEDEEKLKKYLRAVLKEGVSSILMTTLSASVDKIESYLVWISKFIKKAPWNNEAMAKIVGIHVEGPFINTKEKGAQNPEYIIPPSIELIRKFQELSDNNIRLLSYAPEKTTIEFQKVLNELKIVGSCGHSECPSKTLREFSVEGLSQITHTFNAMPSLHHREIGIIGEAFLNKKLNCELISDKIHVHPDAMRILIKNITLDRLQIITDSIFVKGLKNGAYKFEGLDAIKRDDSFRLLDGALAGSVAEFNSNLRNIRDLLDLNNNDLVKISSFNQWKNVMKTERSYQDIFVNNKDFFVFDEMLKPLYYINNLGVKKLWN